MLLGYFVCIVPGKKNVFFTTSAWTFGSIAVASYFINNSIRPARCVVSSIVFSCFAYVTGFFKKIFFHHFIFAIFYLHFTLSNL